MAFESENHGSHTITYDLHTDDLECGLQVYHFLEQDTYNVSVTLIGLSDFVNASVNAVPEFHLSGLT